MSLNVTDLELTRKRGYQIPFKIAKGLEEVDFGATIGRRELGRS